MGICWTMTCLGSLKRWAKPSTVLRYLCGIQIPILTSRGPYKQLVDPGAVAQLVRAADS
jgi:hypothetical protein